MSRRTRTHDPYKPSWRHFENLREKADNGDTAAQQVLLQTARAGITPAYQLPSEQEIRERRSLATERLRLRAELQRRLM